jgi:hypothetical protein
MMSYLYKHWPAMCLPMAIYITLVLVSSMHALGLLIFLIWLQFPIYLLHEFEEHAYPGGFKNFVNHEVFGISGAVDMPLNDKNIFWINIPAIWILFPLGAILAQQVNPSIGAILPYFGLFNATIHIIALIVKRKYNPGLGASIILNYPTGIYTLIVMHQHQLLTLSTNIYSFLIALFSHIAIVLFAATKYKRYKAKLMAH